MYEYEQTENKFGNSKSSMTGNTSRFFCCCNWYIFRVGTLSHTKSRQAERTLGWKIILLELLAAAIRIMFLLAVLCSLQSIPSPLPPHESKFPIGSYTVKIGRQRIYVNIMKPCAGISIVILSRPLPWHDPRIRYTSSRDQVLNPRYTSILHNMGGILHPR